MSWMYNLCKTYDVCSEVVGISEADGNQKKMLLPIGHTLKESNVVVWLSQNGQFAGAKTDKIKKNEDKVMICTPCSEESEARSGKNAWKFPYPLFDQMKYLSSEIYVKNLLEWINFLNNKPQHKMAHAALEAVYLYLVKRTIKSDLSEWGIKPTDDLSIRFCVNIVGSYEDRLWMLPEVWSAWISYLWSKDIEKSEMKDVCYILGEEKAAIALKHPKSINRASGNAKLISANDKTNFTYRGRFTEPSQAVTISYLASQKAHQALRWLIMKQSCYRCDSQAIIAWAIDTNTVVPDFYDDSYGIYESASKSDSDKLITAEGTTYIDYANMLSKAICGYSNQEKLKQHVRHIAILATDAATTGRLSVTYYRELIEDEYLTRIEQWHSTCKWYQPFEKKREERHGQEYFIGAPSVDRITVGVLGEKRSAKDKAYDKLKKTLREQLIHCVFDGDKIPSYIVTSAANRASNPFAFENTKKRNFSERWSGWEQALCVACALTKKRYYDYKKEEYEVGLEVERKERNYLFGRLLAIADKIECDARYKQGKSKDDARATNAMRYMTAFSQHPFRTWNLLFTQQLNPYIQQLNGAGWHLNLIGNVMELFADGEIEIDTPLDGRYLLGFFAQRQVLRHKDNQIKKDGGESYESKK